VIHREPHYKTNVALRKPDLVATLGQTAVVVDAQVVAEQTDLAAAHLRKKQYYQDIIEDVKAAHEVIVTSATNGDSNISHVNMERNLESKFSGGT